jgi:hypothetical protein
VELLNNVIKGCERKETLGFSLQICINYYHLEAPSIGGELFLPPMHIIILIMMQ